MSVIFSDSSFATLNDLLSAYNSEHSEKFCLTFVSKDDNKAENYGTIKLSFRPEIVTQDTNNFKLDLLQNCQTFRKALLENSYFGVAINGSDIKGKLIFDWALRFAVQQNGREVPIKPEDTLSIVEVRK